jgi:hypothetical protein
LLAKELVDKIYVFLQEKFIVKSCSTREEVQDELWRLKEQLNDCELLLLDLQKQLSQIRRAKTSLNMILATKKNELLKTKDLIFTKGLQMKNLKLRELLQKEFGEYEELEHTFDDLVELRSLLGTRRTELKGCLGDTKFLAVMNYSVMRGAASSIVRPSLNSGEQHKDAVDIQVFLDDGTNEPKN